MINDLGKSNGPFRKTAILVAWLIALVALVTAERYYKSHQHSLERQLSNSVWAFLMLGMGCFLAWQAVTGMRNGAIQGNFVSTQFKRSDNASLFWFIVVFNVAGATLLIATGIGHFLGAW